MGTNVDMDQRWLDTIRLEGGRLASVSPAVLDAPVPMLADWNVERVVRHVGKVHRWVTGLLDSPADTDPDEVARAAPSLPSGAACLPAYRDALDALVATLEADDPERPTASFLGPTNVRFWLRRQAHEIGIHRVDVDDAIHAVGGPAPMPCDPVSAADGIGEWIEVFVANAPTRRLNDKAASLSGRAFRFVATDVPADAPARVPHEWRVEFGEPGAGPTWSSAESPIDARVGEPVDATLSSSAQAMFLTLWRRRSLDAVTVAGSREAAQLLWDTQRF